jgi:hypothetical protein
VRLGTSVLGGGDLLRRPPSVHPSREGDPR